MSQDDKAPRGTDGTDLIVTGVSVGAIGVVGAVLLGATCPVCVVATPALIGAGLYKKWRAKQGVTPDSAASPDPREEPRR